MQVVEVRETKNKNTPDEIISERMTNIKVRQGRINNIRLCETFDASDILYTGKVSVNRTSKVKIYRYTLHKDRKTLEHFNTLRMPSKKYEPLFDDLILEETLLMKCLSHFYKILHFYSTKVNVSYFNVTKTILVCGPPGTGKSTLSRAIFQRLSVRMTKDTYLVELNASKIFTRYYGDTTGALSKILNGLDELSKSTIIFVTIDEVETLFMNRNLIIDNNEPLEGIRVVNTLLLFLDTLKHNKNIFVMFTSNFYQHLDPAFVDRCDVVLMTSLPNEKTSYCILRNIFIKLMEKSLLEYEDIPEYGDMPFKSVYAAIKDKSPRMIKKLVFQSLPIRKTNMAYMCEMIAKS